MSSHRHAENVLSKVSQRWTLRVGNSCYIPTVMGHPKDMPLDATVFCRFVTSCIVTCQISHYAVWENSQNPNPTHSKYHLLVLSCHSSVHMAHSKSPTTCHRGCSFTHSASDHPSTPSPVVPTTGRFQGPWPLLLAASTAAPAARSRSTAAVRPSSAARCSGVEPQAPKGLETSTAGSTPWVSTAHPRCSGRNCNLWSEVPEFHLLQNCIASWLNGSHYLLLLFVKITWDYKLMEPSTTEDLKKGRPFSYAKQNLSQHISSIPKLSFTPTVGPYR